MQKFIDAVIVAFDRYMPEPFAFGVLMTLVAMLLTWGATEAQPRSMPEEFCSGDCPESLARRDVRQDDRCSIEVALR